jgi:competence protein ComEC
LFITHPHWDHYGGAFALIGKIPIDTVYLPPIPLPLPFDSLMNALDSTDIPVRHLRAGEVVGIDPQTKLYVLSPDSALSHYRDDDGSSINNSSLVLLLKHQQTGILLTGDAEAEAEARLRRWQYFLRCDILKVGHHGSATSSTPALLSYSKPKIACISVGRFNRFGHPDPLILRRLNAIGATVYRTDRQQAVWLRYQNQSWHRIIWK